MNPPLELAITEVISGARLAADAVDTHGKILIPAGATVTESCLAKLIAGGVTRLMIEAEESTIEEIRRQAKYAAVRQRVEFVFRGIESNPSAHELERLVLEYKIKGVA